MAFEMKDNTFTLFDNDKKGNDRAPDYRGRGLINGEEVKVAVWKRTGKTGVEYLSGTVEKTEKTAEVSTTTEPAKELLDDQQIPF